MACGGDHGLGALPGIAADDAVDLGGRTRGDLLDHHPVLFAGRLLQPDLAEKLLGGEAETGKVGLDVRRQFRDAVVEAGNRHATVVVMHRGDDAREHPDRILRRAAEQAGMQVAVGAADPAPPRTPVRAARW